MKIAYICLFSLLFVQKIMPQNELGQLKNYLAEFKYNEVISILEEKKKDAGLSAEEYFLLGLAHQNLYDYESASAAYDSASAGDPMNAIYLLSLGKTMVLNDKPEEASYTFNKIFAFDPSNKQAKIEIAKLYYDRKKYNDAIIFYSLLIEEDPLNSRFIRTLAYSYSRIDSVDKAQSLFSKAIVLNPKDYFAAFHSAKLFYDTGMYDTAKTILENSMKYNPMHAGLNKLLAETYFKIGNYDGAVLHYNNAVVGGDSTASVYQKLGFTYYIIANSASSATEEIVKLKYSEALAALDKSFRLDNSNPLTTFYIGVINKQLGNAEEAERFLTKTLGLIYPDYLPDVYAQLASIYDSRNNFASAIKSYKKAYDLNPAQKNYLFYLASIYDRYYSDRIVPLLYYKKYLVESNEDDLVIKNYALDRINKLTEENHFRKQ